MPPPNTARRKTIALMLSGTFPGLGQFYNREPIKGLAFLVPGIVLSWILGREIPTDPIVMIEKEISRAVIVYFVTFVAVWVWSIVDAWRVAGRPEV
jgi:hypothetical protein